MGLDALMPTSMGRQTLTWKDWLLAQEWVANWETLIEFVLAAWMGHQTSTWKDWLMAQEWAANWETLIEFV
jgi:hypothetical protein